MPDTDNPRLGVTVPLREIYVKVTETSDGVNKINSKLDEITTDINETNAMLKEHESRLRKLESNFSAHNVIITIVIAAMTAFISASLGGLL